MSPLVKLALPIMGTSFIQMTYTMVDIAWLGRLGSAAVAAAGAASFFVWLGNALALNTKIGAEVGVSQSIGAGLIDKARTFASTSLTVALALALVYGVFLFAAAPLLIGFFGLNAAITHEGVTFLRIIAFSAPFILLNATFTSIYNATGQSKIPFFINLTGLAVNMVLDPFLIFGIGFPKMGVAGAALATTLSQGVVTSLFIYEITGPRKLFKHFQLFVKPQWYYVKMILKRGFPASLQNSLFAFFSMNLARIAAEWGYLGVTAQSVGAQIEAISWNTAQGFSTALSAFVGQNYGARMYGRIRNAYFNTMGVMAIWGTLIGGLFIVFGGEIFGLFVPEPEAIKEGAIYLRILGFSQLFMVFEITSTGAFTGIGRTLPPSILGITLTGSRIPLAIALTATSLQLSGVWWSITISSILKGIILPLMFIYVLHRIVQLHRKCE
ncbi:MATE family efflux transporter [Acetobacteroides hydrogenigenes]|uniref:Multidrug-efflux transporter n=1 Tax=Acetobacteroides hydrogenigenes TaxID=979970 RepID=A0A4V2RQ82_9BACT|nr:MATE family efflux transporter [Acetobacteroides hydrogenigenes]TCN70490.1 putative MATE family efflux protein [Acetobacteroides hydrogenigenes]